jgi:hypothetical protein
MYICLRMYVCNFESFNVLKAKPQNDHCSKHDKHVEPFVYNDREKGHILLGNHQ